MNAVLLVYRKYIYLETHVMAFKEKYEEMLNDSHVGGSIIARSNGSPDYTNIVIKMEGKLFDLKSNLKYYENRLNTLDIVALNWRYLQKHWELLDRVNYNSITPKISIYPNNSFKKWY